MPGRHLVCSRGYVLRGAKPPRSTYPRKASRTEVPERHLVAFQSYRNSKFNIQHSKLQQGVVADTYQSPAYRGYDSDVALRAVGVIPTATHKMSCRTCCNHFSTAPFFLKNELKNFARVNFLVNFTAVGNQTIRLFLIETIL